MRLHASGKRVGVTISHAHGTIAGTASAKLSTSILAAQAHVVNVEPSVNSEQWM